MISIYLKKIREIDPLAFLALTVLLYILRMAIPYVNYVFIPVLVLYICYSITYFISEFKLSGFRPAANFGLLQILISVFLLWGFLISSGYSLFILKEVLNTSILLFLCFSLFLNIQSEESFIRFTETLNKKIIFFSFIISILGILKFLIQLRGIEIGFLRGYQQMAGTSLIADYNFYCLFSILGLFTLIYNRSKYNKTVFFIILISLALNIVLSGSRRGIVMIVIIGIVLFSFGLNNKSERKRIGKNVLSLFVILIIVILTFIIFRRQSLFHKTNQSQDLKGKTEFQLQNLTTQILFRYLTIMNSGIEYDEFYDKLWLYPSILDSKMNYAKYSSDPESNDLLYNGDFRYGLLFWKTGADATRHEIIATPFGKGVRVSRFDGDGLNFPLLYAGRNIVFYANHKYVLIFKFRVVKGPGIPFQIGYWANDSYRGYIDALSLPIDARILQDGWKEGTCSYSFIKSHYNVPFLMNSQRDSSVVEFAEIKLVDMTKQPDLPKYCDEISDDAAEIEKFLKHFDDSVAESGMKLPENNSNLISNGDFRLGLLYWMPNADSTSHSIINTPYGNGIRVTRTNGDGGWWSLRYTGRPIVYYAGHSYKFSFKYNVRKGNGRPFCVGWWVEDGGQGFNPTKDLPIQGTKLGDGWIEATCTYRFRETHNDLPTFINDFHNNSIVDFADVELIDLDRVDSLPFYVDQINELNDDKKSLSNISNKTDQKVYKNNFYGPRASRWLYSWVVFKDSLSAPQKIFGGGFDYLKMFGTEFGEVEYDYPHNPFLSAFLYSGIVGGIAYIWFMFLVFYYYIKYYRHHIYFFICFLVTFYFSFFSVNTHFTIPAFALFSMIPFLTRYLVENEKKASDTATIKTNP
jgi:hypothetical protein